MPNSERSGLYFQYGCGLSAPDGWLKYDSSPTLRLQRLPLVGPLFARNVRFPDAVQYGDVVAGLPPLADNSADGAYCSHVLEHLALEDLRGALRETLRVLKPNAVFRLVLPDIEYLAKTYLENDATDAALEFMRTTHLGVEMRPHGIKSFIVNWIGNSKHLWMWDFKALEAELSKVGFQDIRRAEFGDGADPAFGARKPGYIRADPSALGLGTARNRLR